MSTRMYSYRITKERWWELADDVRRSYLEKHPICEVLESIAREVDPLIESPYVKMVKIADTFDRDWEVELQLFDEGETLLIRPLESGYFFMNNSDRWIELFGLEKVYYNDSVDVPPEDEKNKFIAEWVDKRIDEGLYTVFKVITRHDLHAKAIDTLFKKAHEGSK